MNIEGTNQSALGNLHTIIHLGLGRIGSEIKNHLIEKLDRDALPLLAKEEDGLGGEDEVLQGDALFCLLHRHNPPTIPDCEWCKRTMRRNCKN